MVTVIACVVFVVLGIVGAVKMEDHLTPRDAPTTDAGTRTPARR
ncbi:hypothetical protein [Kineococcus aurantiacus]|uniref:Uncharacterized protein n=1 Tax=Kineococcus aurantiacus TaxID=37633 RepID=A0A7Y9DHX4_9ACTN|nr:hypothetical protein [Kineococcus aurantiacus]NYD21821.1 hypothetical protein [Kineococcus aurantiacus]